MFTCHKLGKAVVQRLREKNVRVRFLTDGSSAKAHWKILAIVKVLTFINLRLISNTTYSAFLILPSPEDSNVSSANMSISGISSCLLTRCKIIDF